MASRLIQIYYKDEQKSACYPFADLHFNDRLTIFFENSIIKDLVLASKDEKIAVCSWKLKEKMRWNVCSPRELTQDVLETDYEVLSFTCNTKGHGMLYAAERWHKGFTETMTKILDSIGQKMPGEVKRPIYQNHFSAKLGIYQDYVNRWLSPAMEVMTNDPKINKMVMHDSNYSQLAKDSAAKSEWLQEKIGVPFYPLAPFILERLFSIYIHNNKIPVTWL